MRTVFVAGADDRTGKLVTDLLVRQGYRVRVLIPDEGQKQEMHRHGVEGIVGDLTGAFSEGLSGVDAVICAVGAGTTRDPKETDHVGTVRLIEQCVLQGIDRFIMISCMETKDPEEHPDLKPYLMAKRKAETILEESTLSHTIIRAGRLTDHESTGCVHTAPELGREGSVSRFDVAQAAVLCLSARETENRSFDLIQGDTPLEIALGELPPIR